jgi:hypothetical protein
VSGVCVSVALDGAIDITGELNGVAVAGAGAVVVYTGNSVAVASICSESLGANIEHALVKIINVPKVRRTITPMGLMLKANDIVLA